MDISGLLLVDKPKAMTSHDVINLLRKKLKIKKIGHAGTLDPESTGLLLVLVSKAATKKASLFSGLDKTYFARLTLGVKTDTADHTGRILKKQTIKKISSNTIKDVFFSFLGDVYQVPPMVSAKKQKGKKLYELARKGITVPRKPQKICIKSIKIKQIKIPNIDFEVTCSKGTYIRTLCEDIATALGTIGCMNGLRRLKVAEYNVADAISVQEIKKSDNNFIAKNLIGL